MSLSKAAATAVFAGLVALGGSFTTAQAASPATPAHTGPAHGLALAKQVFSSANPSRAYARLSAADKAAFDGVEKPVSVNRTVRTAAIRPMSGGCWDEWVRYDFRAAAGNTVYTAWQGLNWCSNGSGITGYHVYDRGGETSTPGWSFQGDNGQGSRNVGWEVRQYTKEKFTFGIGSYGYSANTCVQIRGGATGLYSSSASCSLY
ncbi:hypothetical protein ACIHFE_08255 [Streptomyces sp. NPDC052396]|uniref:hypothetical protein n=1 Tax=Streptomyces sp. NPDC052396 TaxID=3365689 RepID=UPI0037D4A21E